MAGGGDVGAGVESGGDGAQGSGAGTEGRGAGFVGTTGLMTGGRAGVIDGSGLGVGAGFVGSAGVGAGVGSSLGVDSTGTGVGPGSMVDAAIAAAELPEPTTPCVTRMAPQRMTAGHTSLRRR